MLVSRAIFNPLGNLIAAGYTDGTIGVWDLETGQLVRQVKSQSGSIRSLAWSHDGRTLAAGTQNGEIFVWASDTFGLISTIKEHKTRVDSLAYSSDDHMLVSVSTDGEVFSHIVTK